ncbi:MAG: gamma-glutamyl-gamma-aminobutyrate hydrolase family protein [Planctomycetes bacterium]|nr:gamma-glutamyl-gamma-aminobutyrate hydrolase family protein [Planctomycetota bacterium]
MKPRIGVACSTMDEVEGRGVRRLHVPEPYVARVEEAGGLPLLLPVSSPSSVAEYLSLVDAVLLVGGDDVDPALYGAPRHPELGPVDRRRDEFEIALVRAVVRGQVPTLGVCRGLQVMNVAMGGTLVQHIPAEVPGAQVHGGLMDEVHPIDVVPGSRLATLVGAARADVNSHHHQAIARLAPGLVVSARADDGVIEAVEGPGPGFLVGVQWHPERMPASRVTAALFRAFLDAVRAR